MGIANPAHHRVNPSDRCLKAQVAPSLHTGGRPDRGINAAVRDLGIDRTEAQRSTKIAGLDDTATQAARDCGCLISVARRTWAAHAPTMFAVDEATAAAIRNAFNERGELSAIVEFRRHFPLTKWSARSPASLLKPS